MRHPCACCGYVTIPGRPGSHHICKVCGWEDDEVQLRWPTQPGSNGLLCLIDAQSNFAILGRARLPRDVHLRPPAPDEARPPDWRPIDLALDDFEPPTDGETDMGRTYPADATELYYWSERFWRRRPLC
jgi:hypothetical protein